jgi:hypothetical protein
MSEVKWIIVVEKEVTDSSRYSFSIWLTNISDAGILSLLGRVFTVGFNCKRGHFDNSMPMHSEP